MRHHAWLTIPPRADKPSERSRARCQSLPEDAPHREYPALEDADGLLDWLQEVGWCQWGEWGAVGLSWGEWAAWQRLTSTPLDPWQARLLFVLSQSYAVAANEARDPQALPPYDPQRLPDPLESERQRTRILAAFGASVSDG